MTKNFNSLVHRYMLLIIISCVSYILSGQEIDTSFYYSTISQDTIFVDNISTDSISYYDSKDMPIDTVLLSNIKLNATDIISDAIFLEISNNYLFFNTENSIQKIAVNTNATEWDFHINSEWCTVVKDKDTLCIQCSQNHSITVRESNLTITAGDKQSTVYIAQQAGNIILTIEPQELFVDAMSGQTLVEIQSNIDQWYFSSECDWCEISRQFDHLIINYSKNPYSTERVCNIQINSGEVSKTLKIIQDAKGTLDKEFLLIVNSTPKDAEIYIDNVLAGKTPFETLTTYDLTHKVKVWKYKRKIKYKVDRDTILMNFNIGRRFIEVTSSSTAQIGFMSGFTGNKVMGAYNHFEVSLPFIIKNMKLSPNLKHGSKLSYSLGPVFKVNDMIAIYSGVGAGIYSLNFDDYKNNFKENFGLEAELGGLVRYKNYNGSAGVKLCKIATNQQYLDFSIGVGMNDDRYFIDSLGLCVSDSRRWWSFNLIYNPSSFGIMISDMGKGSVRSFIKFMYGVPKIHSTRYSFTTGLVFTIVPSHIDYYIGGGGGLFADKLDQFIGNIGGEVETGFTINIWRVPLSIGIHSCKLGMDNPTCEVDLGIGFSFGEFKKKKHNL
ncbi:MAG: BACON domain-containing carbohydrate-binding protein [Bacteroidales bacterium]|jgi:hypothetical protein|nr:BACON domain-containing protein [Bacteroidales bacterium]MDD2203922.1 BACON domain-containing carbohydrate-binding protein [Bacteroidales bacterium]MDD3152793.1 BACON domain-containing carbohydrate-binding protein [Bacteroidales bacterium]MDD3913063.1 BACON domain-containing carbohydrate-binding protein [Bacteroidales bacterium]MDD4632978.1 BACON domain-containing carbohydrate-binding protein [Bacteroidales bacterium]